MGLLFLLADWMNHFERVVVYTFTITTHYLIQSFLTLTLSFLDLASLSIVDHEMILRSLRHIEQGRKLGQKVFAMRR